MFQNESLVLQFEDSFSNPCIDEVPEFINNLINCGWTIDQIFAAYNEFAAIYSSNDDFPQYAVAVWKEFQTHGLAVCTEDFTAA